MKRFDISTVESAYLQIKDCTRNKFWGIMSILYSLKQQVFPCKVYKIETSDMSNFLENTFCLDDYKKEYNGDNSWYVCFSTQWIDCIKDQMLLHTPNIYWIIVWIYRNRRFLSEPSTEELLSMFINDFNLNTDFVNELFDTTNNQQILYSEHDYTDVELFQKLKPNLKLGKARYLTAEGSTIVAQPGELSRAPFIQTLYASQMSLECLILAQTDINKLYVLNSPELSNLKDIKSVFYASKKTLYELSYQLIYYGAPGTGKSYKINQETKDNPNVIRTTFHPDSDYSTFVGAYKPTMRKYNTFSGYNRLDGDSQNDNKEEIVYEFVPQAFLQAYVNAWKLLAEANDDNSIQPEFLIIEEINRGNCAQIFGDLFQLLDRGGNGFSDYPIHSDKDLQGYLKKTFQDEWLKKAGEKNEELKANLNRIYGKEEDINRVLDGEILLLPCNLYIWATMNTSDQSLFPIDSAFKRRWDWKYVPISRGKDKDGNPLQWKIKAGDKEYDWWSFLQKINERIYKATESEDKQLGYFFCKAGQNGCITSERFVNKVLFYLWNDVFKDYDTKDVFPEDYPTFDRYFTEDGNADDKAVESFLNGLEVESVTADPHAQISETSGEKTE